MTKQIKDNEFEFEVLNSKLPVIIDFWAEWCGPCRMIAPILEEVAKELEGKIKILKLNIDENPSMPAQLGVRSIPTLALFKNGQAISTKVGLVTKTKIIEWVGTAV